MGADTVPANSPIDGFSSLRLNWVRHTEEQTDFNVPNLESRREAATDPPMAESAASHRFRRTPVIWR